MQLDKVVQQNASVSEESASMAEELASQAMEMQEGHSYLDVIRSGEPSLRISVIAESKRTARDVPSHTVRPPRPRTNP